jgi:MoxR-like ATPase
MLAARARALIDGRLAPSLDDVRALAKSVLQHRLALTYEARAQDQTPLTVIERLVARI